MNPQEPLVIESAACDETCLARHWDLLARRYKCEVEGFKVISPQVRIPSWCPRLERDIVLKRIG